MRNAGLDESQAGRNQDCQEQEPAVEEKSSFQFSSREKRVHERIIFQCAGFKPPLSPSSRGSLVPLHFLP